MQQGHNNNDNINNNKCNNYSYCNNNNLLQQQFLYYYNNFVCSTLQNTRIKSSIYMLPVEMKMNDRNNLYYFYKNVYRNGYKNIYINVCKMSTKMSKIVQKAIHIKFLQMSTQQDTGNVQDISTKWLKIFKKLQINM